MVVMLPGKNLPQAADRAVQPKRNRSALIRADHLQKLELQVLEKRDRVGYKRKPQEVTKSRQWEAEAVWPAG